uniref:ATP-binding protein n=1 Tax=Thalassobaculum salexigens TaxID=455360 RepID=UPI00248DD096
GTIVHTRIASDLTVTVNPDEVAQILTNLIVNAQQAMSDQREKKVTLAAGLENGSVHLDVEDGGSGIAPEHREQIFQPFFTTKTGGEGTGLGLYLSSELAARNGAGLSLLESKPSGSTFRLTFEQNS